MGSRVKFKAQLPQVSHESVAANNLLQTAYIQLIWLAVEVDTDIVWNLCK